MASLKPTNAWQSETLTSNEIWQVGEGMDVRLDTEEVESERIGIVMKTGETIQFASGQTIYYRKGHKHHAMIHRIKVA